MKVRGAAALPVHLIPEFEDETGNLQPGIHEAKWVELADLFGSTPRRRELREGLFSVAGVLAWFGCKNIWIDGSFVTAKEDPADYDACWDMNGGDRREVERAEPCIFDLRTVLPPTSSTPFPYCGSVSSTIGHHIWYRLPFNALDAGDQWSTDR